MEFCGIVFMTPVYFIICAFYAIFLAKVVSKWRRTRTVVLAVSFLLLGTFVAELLLLKRLGAVETRLLLGPAFWHAHMVFRDAGIFVLANVLVLIKRSPLATKPYSVGAICAIFSIFQTLLYFSVSDALFGVDGRGGPFS
jgi:hypothetical protein